jgi:hypothetical protein
MGAFCRAGCLRRRGVAGPTGGLLCLLLAGPVVSTVVSVAGPARAMSAKATKACNSHVSESHLTWVVFCRVGCLHCNECPWAGPWDVDLALLVQGPWGHASESRGPWVVAVLLGA